MTSFAIYSIVAIALLVAGGVIFKLVRTNRSLRDALVSESHLEGAATDRAHAVGMELSFIYDEAVDIVGHIITNYANTWAIDARMSPDETKIYLDDLRAVHFVLKKTPKNYLSLPIGRFEASGEGAQVATSNLDQLLTEYSRENIRFIELFVVLRIMIEYKVNFKGAITLFYDSASGGG